MIRIGKRNWALLVVTIILFVAISYINFAFYAGVIGMGLFGGLLGGALFFGIYGSVKKEKRRRVIIVNVGLITLMAIMFIIAMPDYTYEESREIAVADMDQKDVNAVDMPALDHKTVPSNGSSSWLLYDRLYYVGIKDGQQNEIYYVVDPIQGEAIRMNEPFWEGVP